jgi:hypothetical protein
MFFPPLLDAHHIGRAAPVFPISRLGEPSLVTGTFTHLLAALLGTVALVKGGLGIGREPLLTVDAFPLGMLFWHPAFSLAPDSSALIVWFQPPTPIKADTKTDTKSVKKSRFW